MDIDIQPDRNYTIAVNRDSTNYAGLRAYATRNYLVEYCLVLMTLNMATRKPHEEMPVSRFIKAISFNLTGRELVKLVEKYPEFELVPMVSMPYGIVLLADRKRQSEKVTIRNGKASAV